MKNTETGRSMVEMLGVLAIIGVLSVAGIAGYTMAMNKYRANEVLNAASQVVILAKAASAIGTTTTNYTNTSAGIAAPYGSVTITVADGSAAVPAVTIANAGTEPCKYIVAGANSSAFTIAAESCS